MMCIQVYNDFNEFTIHTQNNTSEDYTDIQLNSTRYYQTWNFIRQSMTFFQEIHRVGRQFFFYHDLTIITVFIENHSAILNIFHLIGKGFPSNENLGTIYFRE